MDVKTKLRKQNERNRKPEKEDEGQKKIGNRESKNEKGVEMIEGKDERRK